MSKSLCSTYGSDFMWIRSQDKRKITKASNIVCVKFEHFEKVKYEIYADEYYYVSLGTYSSQSKTIRVLDMIENSIRHGEKIFQMPADEEVEE